MKPVKKKCLRLAPSWVCGGLALGLLGLVGLAQAAEHELRLEAAGATDVGGLLKPATDGLWQGVRISYRLPALGPLSLHIGGELRTVRALSGASASPLDLRHSSFFLGAGVAFPLSRRLELEASGSLSAGTLSEKFSPLGGPGTVETQRTGFGAGVSAGVSIALGKRWRVPVTLHFQRLSFAAPLESITSSQLGLGAGLAFRLGSQPED